jgi:hypothetical protein
VFDAWFDRKYLDEKTTRIPKLPECLKTSEEVKHWIDFIPFLKYEMDLWFGGHPKDEREFQQLMVRENNFGNAAKSTDYFICDIEYANTQGRFDLIAVHWPSSSPARKNNKNLGLAFIEMKYIDNALTGDAGLKDHIESINSFLENRNNLIKIKEEMKNVFNQKQELELLIDNQKQIESFGDNKPAFILALANHDPAKSNLNKELAKLSAVQCQHIDLKFATSNFMGYGLYDQNIYTKDVFLSRFKEQIYYASDNPSRYE